MKCAAILGKGKKCNREAELGIYCTRCYSRHTMTAEQKIKMNQFKTQFWKERRSGKSFF